ncbi:MAG: hypothetical protein ACM3VT_10510 [Solirubrobacterales bacterium]
MKKALFAVAAVAMLAVAAQAGEIKYHEWPCALVPQEITTIPVVMDVGYWVRIKDQDKLKIVLGQDSIHTYSGCTNMTVETNTCLTFSCSIAAVTVDGSAVVPGDYSCSVSPANVNAPGGTVTACATLTNADLSKVAGGSTNVHVANVTVKVVPRSCS